MTGETVGDVEKPNSVACTISCRFTDARFVASRRSRASTRSIKRNNCKTFSDGLNIPSGTVKGDPSVGLGEAAIAI